MLAELNYRNLDDEPAFTGRNTTTEFLARVVFDRIVAAIGRGELGAGARAVESMRVTLHESHVASAVVRGARQRGALIVAAERAGQALTFVVPGDLETRTGGYGYDRRIVAGLRERGWSRGRACRWTAASRFRPAAAREASRRERWRRFRTAATVLVDGLALGVAARRSGARERERLHSSRSSTIRWRRDRPRSARGGCARGQRAARARRRPVRSSSPVAATAAALARYGVARDRIAVVEPGTDRAPLAREAQSRPAGADAAEVALLCVATLTPRKGTTCCFARSRRFRTGAGG